MATTLFTNVRILDGSGGNPVPGSVLVQGNRRRGLLEQPRGIPHDGEWRLNIRHARRTDGQNLPAGWYIIRQQDVDLPGRDEK